MIAWTDRLFPEFGDKPSQEAPIRMVQVLSYDGDRWVTFKVKDQGKTIITIGKRWYLYPMPTRWHEGVKLADVKNRRKVRKSENIALSAISIIFGEYALSEKRHRVGKHFVAWCDATERWHKVAMPSQITLA